MRHFKPGAHFQVTLETSVRRSARINDLALIAAGRDVKTSGTVTSFAAHFLCVIAGRFQPGVGRSSEIAGDGFVTGFAGFRTNKLSARNTGRGKNGAICFERAAGKKNDGKRGCSPGYPQQFLALAGEPFKGPQDSHVADLLPKIGDHHNAFFRKKPDGGSAGI